MSLSLHMLKNEQKFNVARTNWDALVDDEDQIKQTGFLKPNRHYGLFGPTSSGKTALLLDLLTNPKLRNKFKRCFIFTGIPGEDKYILLVKILIEEYGFQPNQIVLTSDIDKFPKVDDVSVYGLLKKSPETLIIYDDFISIADNKIQRKVEQTIMAYLVKSRKLNCSCFLLAQYYFSKNVTPQMRSNLNGGLFIFEFQSPRNVKLFANSISTRVPPEKIEEMYRQAIKIPHGYLTYLPWKKQGEQWRLNSVYVFDV